MELTPAKLLPLIERFLKHTNLFVMELVKKIKVFKRSKELSIETAIELGNILNENVINENGYLTRS